MNILIVDDHPLFREGLKTLLTALEPAVRISSAGTVAEAIALAQAHVPDLILLDMNLPGPSRLDALRQVKAAYEAASVVVVSGDEDPLLIRRAIDEGAAGYIPKTSDPSLTIQALRLVLANGIYLPRAALTAGGDVLRRPTRQGRRPAGIQRAAARGPEMPASRQGQQGDRPRARHRGRDSQSPSVGYLSSAGCQLARAGHVPRSRTAHVRLRARPESRRDDKDKATTAVERIGDLTDELIQLFARQGRRVPIPVFLSSLLLACMAWSQLGGWLPWLWLTAVALMLAVRWKVLGSLPAAAMTHARQAPARGAVERDQWPGPRRIHRICGVSRHTGARGADHPAAGPVRGFGRHHWWLSARCSWHLSRLRSCL